MNSKIKIFVDAHVFDYSYQGTASYLKGLYNSLVKNDDFEITLCAQNLENLKTQFPDDRFRYIELKTGSKLKRLFNEIPNIIKREKFDYAHFQYIVPPIKNCKYIVTIHDVLFLDYKYYFPLSYRVKNRLLFHISTLLSDIILTVSSYSKERITHHFKLNKNDIFVLPNALESEKHDFIKDTKETNQIEKYILYVSRFEPRKNHEGLLKAYIDLELFNKGYRLVFVGSKKAPIEMNAYESLNELITDNLRNKISFIENISYEALFTLYRESECFVYPSFAEGFGIPPVEAAILKCKVLCSNTTAMKDFDFFKYTFDPNNQEEFKLKLSQILKDDHYPYEEIKRAAEMKYNWTKISYDFSNILKNNMNK